MEKVAAIEKYLLDPNSQGSFYQQSFKVKLAQAINNDIICKDIEGLKAIKGKVTPEVVREIFSENSTKWHEFHFPNYDLPQALATPGVKVK